MKKFNILLLFALLFSGTTAAFPGTSTAFSGITGAFSGTTAAAGHVIDSLGIGIYKGVKVVMHKVTPKETFYSIARRYNVHPKYLIRFNSHVQGLKIGDTIRVEVDSMNNFQSLVLVPENDQEATETSPPTVATPQHSTVTEHVVAPRETLFAIGKKYGLTVAELRALNDLADNHIETGQRLIVSASGPIASDPEQVSEVSRAGQAPTRTASVPAGSGAATENKAEPGKKEDKVYTATPTPVLGTPDRMAEREKEKSGRNKDLPKLVREVKESGVAAWISNSSLNQAKSVALHNSAPSGTIIKVTNPANRRSIMVKVVGSIPQNAETENALIVISQSASELLGIRDNRFRANLSYAIQE